MRNCVGFFLSCFFSKLKLSFFLKLHLTLISSAKRFTCIHTYIMSPDLWGVLGDRNKYQCHWCKIKLGGIFLQIFRSNRFITTEMRAFPKSTVKTSLVSYPMVGLSSYGTQDGSLGQYMVPMRGLLTRERERERVKWTHRKSCTAPMRNSREAILVVYSFVHSNWFTCVIATHHQVYKWA